MYSPRNHALMAEAAMFMLALTLAAPTASATADACTHGVDCYCD